MQQLIFALLLGIMFGRLQRGKSYLRKAQAVVLVTVTLLLFVMGAQIGGNPEVISALPSLGTKALVFALLSIAGGVIFSLPLFKGTAHD